RSRVFEVVENAQSRLVKVATWISQCNGARGAVNQFCAELVFKGGDLLADGRLTNSTFLCDRGEAPFFNHSDENLHCIEFIHTDLRIPLWNGCYARNSDSPASLSNEATRRFPILRYAFLLGIAGIPQSAKSACSAGTSR